MHKRIIDDIDNHYQVFNERIVMTNMVSLKDLGIGGGYVVWAFRAAAMRRSDCSSLVRGFEETLSAYGKPALHHIKSMAKALGNGRGRRLTIACPGCGIVTADELSVVAMLAAAYLENDEEIECHLSWLTAGIEKPAVRMAVGAAAVMFRAARVPIIRPKIELSTPLRRQALDVFPAVGRA